MSPPLLSVVIPVYNGAEYLKKLHHEFTPLSSRGLQFVFVDDGSTDDSVRMIEGLLDQQAGDILIRCEQNSGAGYCRNLGWESVNGKYTLFFDVDDLPHSKGIAAALEKLEENEKASVAICSYLYDRGDPAMGTDMNKEDIRVLNKSLGQMQSKCFSLEANSSLLLLTNYPWNKILRTEAYKNTKMTFGNTKVNNDIMGHWTALLIADEIIVSRDIVCTHIVRPTGGNITNQRNETRLEVFTALNQVYDFLASKPHLRRRYCHIFWEFATRLVSWSKSRVSHGMHRRFDELSTDLLSRIELEDFILIQSRRAPSLGNKIKDHFYRG